MRGNLWLRRSRTGKRGFPSCSIPDSLHRSAATPATSYPQLTETPFTDYCLQRMIRSRTKTSIKPTVHHGRDGYHPSRSGIAAVQHFARLDLHRKERTGVPEAVFAMNKTTEQVVSILDKLARQSGQALATRVSDECAKTMRKKLGRIFQVEHNASGGTVLVRRRDFKPSRAGGRIAVLAAGTADIRVAEEARVTAELMG